MGILESVSGGSSPDTAIKRSLTDNLIYLDGKLGGSFDFKIRRTAFSGVDAAFVCLDGMCNNEEIFLSVTNPIFGAAQLPEAPQALYETIRDRLSSNVQQSELLTLDDAVDAILAGNLLLLTDGVTRCLNFSVQGYPKKSIEAPQSSMQERGSHEGFTDSFKDNATLIRRRLKTPELCIENLKAGAGIKTDILLCYMKARAPVETVQAVKSALNAMKIDYISGEGCIEPFLEPNGNYIFRSVGDTERPDVFCAKLTEGKIGIIVDGTPHALVTPYTFAENFQALDDYQKRPYYALFLRAIRILSFIAGVFLPGLYTAVTMYHPEMIPADVLYNIASSQVKTPFPVMMEGLLIHIIYEIVREAGLRMPKAVGHAVSIVGALIIGDAAVTAGLISAPMLIIVALTAVTSAVISEIHDPVSVLRLVFIVVGGLTGVYGIFLGAGLILLNICAEEPMGYPFSLPALPFKKEAARDMLVRRDWRVLGRKRYSLSAYLKNGR
ncbi:MAG: spore germination protein [Clostridia bacterium]|nr:spore germination protein [Clostridia bacterium]